MVRKTRCRYKHLLPGGVKFRNDFTLNGWGELPRMKEKLMTIVNVECDDKNYGTMNEIRRNGGSIVVIQLGT